MIRPSVIIYTILNKKDYIFTTFYTNVSWFFILYIQKKYFESTFDKALENSSIIKYASSKKIISTY